MFRLAHIVSQLLYVITFADWIITILHSELCDLKSLWRGFGVNTVSHRTSEASPREIRAPTASARHSGDDPGDGRRGWGFDNVGDTSWSLGVARSQTPRPTPVLARIYGVRPTLFKELDMICTSLPSASAVRGRILCLQMRNENQRVASTVTCTAKVLSLDVT